MKRLRFGNEERTQGFTNLKSIVEQTTLKHAISAFEALNLRNVKNLFKDPEFRVWLKYVDDLNNKTPDKASAASVLVKQYGDARFSKMLLVAMKDRKTEALARTLQDQLFKRWKNQNISPLQVFTFLNLGRGDIISNPLLTSWLKYMDEFMVRNPTTKKFMLDAIYNEFMVQNPTTKKFMLDAIYNDFDERTLAQVLEAGLKVKATKTISSTLETDLFIKWERMSYTPNIAFKAVGLNQGTGSLLLDPVFNLWVRYMSEYNTKHPGVTTSTLSTLRKHYSDKAIENMIAIAKNEPATRHIANNLESLLITEWQKSLSTFLKIYKQRKPLDWS
ncbi:RxLR effector protein [Phytophthora megakarya]|uniref:RxLR effector protein n=1 Tax=Phytophthora megakarya TaxID=4795 RepID=A0A225UU24_9STRA|nr:RxLR effector protein [Phytophthora megakarya]